MIAEANVDKAMRWPAITSDDGEGLQFFGLYLAGCCSDMDDMGFMDVFGNAYNKRDIGNNLF